MGGVLAGDELEDDDMMACVVDSELDVLISFQMSRSFDFKTKSFISSKENEGELPRTPLKTMDEIELMLRKSGCPQAVIENNLSWLKRYEEDVNSLPDPIQFLMDHPADEKTGKKYTSDRMTYDTEDTLNGGKSYEIPWRFWLKDEDYIPFCCTLLNPRTNRFRFQISEHWSQTTPIRIMWETKEPETDDEADEVKSRPAAFTMIDTVLSLFQQQDPEKTFMNYTNMSYNLTGVDRMVLSEFIVTMQDLFDLYDAARSKLPVSCKLLPLGHSSELLGTRDRKGHYRHKKTIHPIDMFKDRIRAFDWEEGIVTPIYERPNTHIAMTQQMFDQTCSVIPRDHWDHFDISLTAGGYRLHRKGWTRCHECLNPPASCELCAPVPDSDLKSCPHCWPDEPLGSKWCKDDCQDKVSTFNFQRLVIQVQRLCPKPESELKSCSTCWPDLPLGSKRCKRECENPCFDTFDQQIESHARYINFNYPNKLKKRCPCGTGKYTKDCDACMQLKPPALMCSICKVEHRRGAMEIQFINGWIKVTCWLNQDSDEENRTVTAGQYTETEEMKRARYEAKKRICRNDLLYNPSHDIVDHFVHGPEVQKVLPLKADEPVIVIKAGLGAGKTKQMAHHISRQLAVNPDLKVLFLSSKRSYAHAQTSRLRGGEEKEEKENDVTFEERHHEIEEELGFRVTNYLNEREGLKKGEAVNRNFYMISCESLHRVNQGYDIIVLDEVTSLAKAMDSKFHGVNKNENRRRFEQLMKRAQSVIAMDGYIDHRCFHLLRNCRPDDYIAYHEYTYKPHDGKSAIYVNEVDLLQQIRKAIEDGENIAIVCSEAKAGVQFIESEVLKVSGMTQDNVAAYYGGCSDQLRTHFKDVNTHWKTKRVVIYNSVVGAGISFDDPHFDRLFMFCSSRGPCTRDMMQLKSRIRRFKNPEMIYTMRNVNFVSFPTRIDEIRRQILDRAHAESKTASIFQQNGVELISELEEEGLRYSLNETWWTELTYMNIREDNFSKVNWKAQWEVMLENEGMIVENRCVAPTRKDAKELKEAKKEFKELNQAEEIAQFDNARPFEDIDEVAEVEKRIANETATQEDMIRIMKHNFISKVKPEFQAQISGEHYLAYKHETKQLDNIKMELEWTQEEVNELDVQKQHQIEVEQKCAVTGKKKSVKISKQLTLEDAQRSRLGKWMAIKEICRRLGLQSSVTEGAVFNNMSFKTDLPFWIEFCEHIQGLFKFRKLKPAKTWKVCSNIVFEAIKDWSGSVINPHHETDDNKKKRITVDGKQEYLCEYTLRTRELARDFYPYWDGIKRVPKQVTLEMIQQAQETSSKVSTLEFLSMQ